MTAKLKSILIISLKAALNAILTSTAIMAFFNDWSWVQSGDGWLKIGKVVLGAVLAREGTVWLPKLLAWSQSSEPAQTSAPARGE